MPRIFRILPLLAVLSAACESPSHGSEGDLGQEQFFYVCVEASDLHCLDQREGLPRLLAVGGRFRLDTTPGGLGNPRMRPASTQLVSTSGGEFEFLEPGLGAFLAFDTSGRLSDFTHLQAVDADLLRVFATDRQEVTALALTAGETLTLLASPFRDSEALAGGFVFKWSSSDSRILQVPARTAATLQIRGVAVGSATLTVSASSELSATVTVTVTAAPPRPSASATSPAPDAAADRDAGDAGPADAQVADTSTTPRADAEAPAADANTPPDANLDAGDAALEATSDAQGVDGGAL